MYELNCEDCKAAYMAKTSRRFRIRVREDMYALGNNSSSHFTNNFKDSLSQMQQGNVLTFDIWKIITIIL